MRKYHTNSNWETFYEITDHTRHNCEGHERWEKIVRSEEARETQPNAMSDPG